MPKIETHFQVVMNFPFQSEPKSIQCRSVAAQFPSNVNLNRRSNLFDFDFDLDLAPLLALVILRLHHHLVEVFVVSDALEVFPPQSQARRVGDISLS